MKIDRAIAAGCVGFVYSLGIWFFFIGFYATYYEYTLGVTLGPLPPLWLLGCVSLISLIVKWHYARRFYDGNNTEVSRARAGRN